MNTFEATEHLAEVAAGSDTASTEKISRVRAPELSEFRDAPRSWGKGQWGSQRLSVAWERAEHIRPSALAWVFSELQVQMRQYKTLPLRVAVRTEGGNARENMQRGA